MIISASAKAAGGSDNSDNCKEYDERVENEQFSLLVCGFCLFLRLYHNY
jgi:hypothetical protein